MSNTLTPQLADLAIRFLSRVSLNGEEVNAFVAVRQGLESVASSEAVVPQLEAVDEQPDLATK